MLWNVSVFLKVLTVNIYGKNRKEIPFIFYIVVIVALMTYFYVYLVSMIWFVVVRTPETGDLVAAMVIISLGVSSEIGILKLLYMYFYINKFRALTDSFLEFDARIAPGSRVSRNLLRYMRNVKMRALIYWGVLMGNGSLYIWSPLARPGRHLNEDLLIIYGLEPMFESPNYEIAWAMMAGSVYAICYISANVTCYLVVIIGYAESQILALSDEVMHIWTDAEEHYKTIAKTDDVDDNYRSKYDRKSKIMNEHVCATLKDIMKRHATIKTLLNQIEDVCRGLLAVGFFFLILGIISELLGGLENTLLQLPFAFMQVGIDCFIGQRVMDAGDTFEKAVYSCQWENFDKKNMKLILVMLQASQKTPSISAGGMTKMNFVCLMGTIRGTYSAYTALRSSMK
uniref:Odorant receptor n=1 Tax=Heliothis virescens TaxID=7102 RepID=A0A2A4JAT4_HELVI